MGIGKGVKGGLRSYEIFGVFAQRDVFGEVKGVGPVNDLAVGVMRVLGAERRPADKTLEHDCAGGPPVAREGVALAAENLGRDVVWSSDRGVGHDAAGLTPGVDLRAVADRKVDLVNGDGVTVARLVGRAFQELLIIGVFMLRVEAGGKTKICKFDVAASVEEDVVWFYIASKCSRISRRRRAAGMVILRRMILRNRGIGKAVYEEQSLGELLEHCLESKKSVLIMGWCGKENNDDRSGACMNGWFLPGNICCRRGNVRNSTELWWGFLHIDSRSWSSIHFTTPKSTQ